MTTNKVKLSDLCKLSESEHKLFEKINFFDIKRKETQFPDEFDIYMELYKSYRFTQQTRVKHYLASHKDEIAKECKLLLLLEDMFKKVSVQMITNQHDKMLFGVSPLYLSVIATYLDDICLKLYPNCCSKAEKRWRRNERGPTKTALKKMKQMERKDRELEDEQNIAKSGIALVTDNKILIVKQKCSRKWSLPKGSKNNEESCREASKRELFEETGIKIPPGAKSFEPITLIANYKKDDCRCKVFVYKCKEELKIGEFDENEIEDCLWMPFNDIPLNKCNNFLNTFLERHLKNYL